MEAQIIQFETHFDQRGALTVAECETGAIPFVVKRVFWITTPHGTRGQHAHKNCEQVLVPLAGSCRVTTDGISRRLWQSGWGLYVPCGVTVTLEDFSSDAVILVLCSQHYDKEDYLPATCGETCTCTCTDKDAEVTVCVG